ncbi:MAG: recombinase family protein [Eubacterium coprostanoligenes]|nr:recombinase family protein [Eubacterium coprostanoligenes]
MAKIYGYIRVSTLGQARDGNSLEVQEKQLRNAGATDIFADAYTGTKTDRPEFSKLLQELNNGDTLVVTKIDRFARSASQGCDIVDALLVKGVKVHILNMGMMDGTPTGKLIRHIMFAFAEFERDMIVERTQSGKAAARARSDYREGRPKKYTKSQLNHALELYEQYPMSVVTQMTGISKSTLMRYQRVMKKDQQI